jgi:uncharacterized membrane protein YedE/YeeE
MQEADLPRLTATVLWSAFALSVLFGAIANRTRFCTMGAVADIVHMGDWARMRMWVLGMAVAIIGFNGMVAMGWVQAASSIYAGRQLLWMSTLVGGAMFGFGMVLGSGCGSRSLVRLGAGNLKSLVVLVVMGVTAFATLKGLTAVWRVRTVDAVVIELPTGQDLPSLLAAALHWPVPQTALVLGVLIASLMLAWVLRDAAGRSAEVLLGGLGVGAIIVALWWVSGRLGYLAEHPETLQEAFLATNSRRMESLSLASPVAYTLDWLLFYSDASKVLTIGIVSVLGLPVGSAIVAKATGTFRWEGFGNVRDLGNHLVGASLMGVGGVTALGCTVGQGMSGISTLSLGSLLAVAAIVVGAIAGVRYQTWQIEREA